LIYKYILYEPAAGIDLLNAYLTVYIYLFYRFICLIWYMYPFVLVIILFTFTCKGTFARLSNKFYNEIKYVLWDSVLIPSSLLLLFLFFF